MSKGSKTRRVKPAVVLSTSAAWPFPSKDDRTKVEAPPQDVVIEPQNRIEAMQRGAEKRRRNHARDMKGGGS